MLIFNCVNACDFCVSLLVYKLLGDFFFALLESSHVNFFLFFFGSVVLSY